MSTEPRKDGTGAAGRLIRSLSKELWPLADRTAWEEACRPGMRLTRGGAASHLRAVTQNDLAKRYGYFLDFVSRSRRLKPEAKAGAHVTLENVEPYVAELKGRVSSVTVYGSIQKLRRIIQFIAPERDIAWLMEIERDLLSEVRPKSMNFVEQSAMPPACRAVSRQHGRVPCRRADPEVRLLTDYEKKRHVTNPAQHGDAEHTFGASSR